MKVVDGGVYLLKRHLDRLSASALTLGFPCNIAAIHDFVLEAVVRQPETIFVARLLLSSNGEWQIEFRPFPPPGLRTALRIASGRVDSSDQMLYHKSTMRNIYDYARAGMPEEMDALLVNKRGEVTETTIANVAVKRSDVWITPFVSCGLLPGTMRAQLLEDDEIREDIVRLKDLAPGELIRCFNAVRGVWDARLVG